MARTKQTARRATGTSGGDQGAARPKQETSSGKQETSSGKEVDVDSSLDSEENTKKRARDEPSDDDDDDDERKVQPERKVQRTESSASAAEGNNHVDVHEQWKQFMAKRKPHKTRVGDFATVETAMVLPQGQFSTRVIYDDYKAARLGTPVMECYRADSGLVAILNHSNVVSRVEEQSRDPSWNRKV